LYIKFVIREEKSALVSKYLQVMPKKFQIFQEFNQEFAGISPINFRKFGYDFGTRNARKSIKGSKDLYYSLVSNKTLIQTIGSFGMFPGDDDVIEI